MITLPSESLFSVGNLVWEKKRTHKPVQNSLPPADPKRQANRLAVKVLKMLTARTGHILHPDYLQPLPSTPIGPIEVHFLPFSLRYHGLMYCIYSSFSLKNLLILNVTLYA